MILGGRVWRFGIVLIDRDEVGGFEPVLRIVSGATAFDGGIGLHEGIVADVWVLVAWEI